MYKKLLLILIISTTVMAAEESTLSIEQRAKNHWAFQPVVAYPAPAINNAHITNDIDRFIVKELQTQKITPGPKASKEVLLRRASYDLIGLPPSPEEIKNFVNDTSENAFEKVVERLLASPHYGERWGRHWLDLARYSDTSGDSADFPIPQIYKYRNYVIDAFNQDTPYDQFLQEQIAGDLIAKAKPDNSYSKKIIATGFLAVSRRFSVLDERYKNLVIEDSLNTIGQSVLGLTIGCARCHDHKNDPISTKDYYSLYGFFNSTQYPLAGCEDIRMPRDFVPLHSPHSKNKKWLAARKRKEEIEKEIDEIWELDPSLCERGVILKKKYQGMKRERTKKAKEKQKLEKIAANKKNKKIANKKGQSNNKKSQKKKPVTKKKKLSPEELKEKKRLRKIKKKYLEGLWDEWEKILLTHYVYGVTDAKKISDSQIHIRGEDHNKGVEVKRGFPTFFNFKHQAGEVTKKDSGRLALAKWLTDKNNPLTARVMVNRIWRHHFGRGLAAYDSDFGLRALTPTHPQLLDYLAVRFMETWSIKSMHRLMMLSQTYQRASYGIATNDKIDPSNRLYWRANTHRLDAESIRDAVLLVSGELDLQQPLGHSFPSMYNWKAYSQHKPFQAVYATKHRSVYMMTQRFKRHPFLDIFDGADTNKTTGQRATTLLPSQALFFMNSPLIDNSTTAWAKKLLTTFSNEKQRLSYVYYALFGREVTDSEKQQAIDYLNSHKGQSTSSDQEDSNQEALASYLKVLICSNEFVYLD